MNKEQFIYLQETGNVSIPVILFQHYSKLGLNEEELMVLLQVQQFKQMGNQFPTPTELSEHMSISTSTCTSILRSLIQRGFLSIEECEENTILFENYSLKPLWDKLYTFLSQEKNREKNKEADENLYTIFENEFGRPLSPIECETLAIWLDQEDYDPIIIKAALRESVMSGKLNFRYIDRILFEWKKNGIRTIEQARNHSKKFRQHQANNNSVQQNQEEYKRKVPFYNWLES
ncbi:DNA replication protein DnaD [Bacillus sp. 7586-K]|uniref:DNA replication protein n=1 Tax=Metabacillus niabensis TaxID=324854 RepID=A0ABT9Z1H5_9BACI|nr:DnaD domain-containing protein [Metabacillus niabensis]MDQ0225140.1 DNA replication protein [Metabacillus niabensis]PAD67212.1 DNA replication protein DnaD [Bacillus sp. 7586-K]